MELAAKGDLFDMIQETRKLPKIPHSICRLKFMEILNALQ